VELRSVADQLGAFGRALVEPTQLGQRIERVPGPFLWYF
jgi:hypothetical protein